MRHILNAILGVSIVVAAATIAVAGPHEGGTLIIHAESNLTYTTDNDGYCGVATPEPTCANVNACVTGDEPVVLFVLAAFSDLADVDLAGVEFGIEYDDADLTILEHGTCADLILPTSTWPSSGEGVALTWQVPLESTTNEVYWFAAYNAYGNSTEFAVADHPDHGASFADSQVPSTLDPVAGFGVLGFNSPGTLPCPDACPISCSDSAVWPWSLDYLVEVGSPLVLYADPGMDNLLSFQLCVPDDVENLGVFEASVLDMSSGETLCELEGLRLDTPVDVGPVYHDRQHGLARVTIAATTSGGTVTVRSSGLDWHPETDTLYGNVATLNTKGLHSIEFTVPETADILHLRLNEGVWYGQARVQSPSGTEWTGDGLSIDVTDEPRGADEKWIAEWEVMFEREVGSVQIEFETATGQRWVPSFVYRWRLGLSDVLPSPLEGPQIVELGNDAHLLLPVPPTGPVGGFFLASRQTYGFATQSAVAKHVTFVNRRAEPLWLEVEQDGITSHVAREQDESYDLLVTSESPARVRVARAARYTLASEAEIVTTDADPGLALWADDEATSTEEILCLVPQGSELGIQVEVSRDCGWVPGECIEGTRNYAILTHPQTDIEVIDAASVTQFQGATDVGTGMLSAVCSGKGGIWRVRVSTPGRGQRVTVALDTPGGFCGTTQSILQSGDNYLAVPLMVLNGNHSRFVDGSGSFPAEWKMLVDQKNVASAWCVDVESGEGDSWLVDGLLTANLEHGSPASKFRKRVRMRTWMGEDLDLGVDSLYVLTRALGLSSQGSIRSSAGGDAGAEIRPIGVVNGISCREPTSPSDCDDEFVELAERADITRTFGPPYTDYGYDRVGMTTYITQYRDAVQQWHQEPDWEDWSQSAGYFMDEDAILFSQIFGEPLQKHGLSRERVFEAAYRYRVVDARHPMAVNEEPGLLEMREISSAVEVWKDEEYHRRGSLPVGWEYPLCNVVTQLERIRSGLRDDEASAMSILGGFVENGRYETTTPDELMSTALALVAQGIDAVVFYYRFNWIDDVLLDLAEENPVLWQFLTDAFAGLDVLRTWMADGVMDAYYDGAPVVGCGTLPFAVALGSLDADDEHGAWFAVSNLAPIVDGNDQAVVLDIGDFWASGGLLYLDYSASGVETTDVVLIGDNLSVSLSPGEWVLGRLLGDPTSDVSTAGADPSSVRVLPSPSSGSTRILLGSSFGSEARIEIFDAGGRNVASIAAVGGSSVLWTGEMNDGSVAPSGMYYLRVYGAGESQTTSLVRLNLR